MQPLDFPGTNLVLKAPPGWDEEQQGPCVDLHVFDDGECMTSKWRPTLWERVKLIFGQPVQLQILSRSHPPVMLTVE